MVAAEEFVQLVARPVLKLLFDAAPFVIKAAQASRDAYARLPMEYVQLIVGAVLCFFGGFYPTFFAALQVSEYSYDITNSCVVIFKSTVHEYRRNHVILFSYCITYNRPPNTGDSPLSGRLWRH